MQVLIRAEDGTITLVVDGQAVGTQTLDGDVDDCGAASDNCIFFIGQKASTTGDTQNFEGLMAAAAVFRRGRSTGLPIAGNGKSTTSRKARKGLADGVPG